MANAPLVGTLYQDNIARLLPHRNAGLPTNGTSGTFANYAAIGSLLIDTTGGGLYQNEGTIASPTWVLVSGGILASSALSKQFSVAGVGNGADTTEDTLFTYTLPANALASVGNEIDITAWGTVAATSATKTVKVYFGTSIVPSAVYTTTQTGSWEINLTVFKQAASVQIAHAEVDSGGATTTRAVSDLNGSETDTAGIVIKVTGQSSVATANLVLCNGFIVAGQP